VSGQSSLQGQEIIVDELYAKSKKLALGMPIEILGNRFTISGICQPGSVVRKYVSLKTLQQLNGSPAG